MLAVVRLRHGHDSDSYLLKTIVFQKGPKKRSPARSLERRQEFRPTPVAHRNR